MKVPFVALDREYAEIRDEVLEAVDRVGRSGRVIYGAELEAFEHEIAQWHGVKHAIGVASGTDAVEIAIRAHRFSSEPLGVTTMTAVPTINAIEAAGAVAVLRDPDLDTMNVEFPADLETNVVVHLFGAPAGTCAGGGVEDCAHAMGATINGHKVGTRRSVGALSFYSTKIMGAMGDGGCLITNEDRIAERARQIRHYGFNDERTDVIGRGQNSRLCEIQAAVLRLKLRHVEDYIARRQKVAARYISELAGRVQFQRVLPGCTHVYHVFAIRHPDPRTIQEHLQQQGIETMRHYPKAIHQYSRWRQLGEPGQFPNAEKIAREVLSLPCHPHLTEAEQDAVIKAVKEAT